MNRIRKPSRTSTKKGFVNRVITAGFQRQALKQALSQANIG